MLKTFYTFNLKTQLANKKWVGFFLLALLFAVGGGFVIIEDRTNYSIYSLFLISSLIFIDVANIRYQRSLEYTQLVVLPLSLKQKYIHLIFNELLGFKFPFLLIYLIAILYSKVGNVSFFIFYLLLYFCICNTLLFIRHFAARYKWVSVGVKQIAGGQVAFAILVVSTKYHHFVYDNMLFLKIILVLFLGINVILIFKALSFIKNRHPVLDLNIVNKYNKKYWY